jgi:hypothetical protein
MILTTPVPERYTRFSCPNPHCALFNRPGEGNIAHRSWTGTHKHIERLRCTTCGRECSEREGTLMARSKLPEATVAQLLKCQRWGVCDAGTADICAVALKTVHRFQRVAAHRAEVHHRQSVQHLEVQGVQWDEAHAKLRPQQVEWVHTALAMGSWFLLWVDFGPRNQDTAAALSAQVVARTRALPLCLTDGWKASTAALLQVLGVVYRRQRHGKVGRKPKPRLGGSADSVLRPGGQGAQHDWPCRGGQPAWSLRWPTPFWQAVAPAPARHDDSDGLYGTLVWHLAWAGRAPAAPHPVSILEPHAPPREGLACGQPLQLCDAA